MAGGADEGMDVRRTLAFLEGLGGLPGPVCLRERRRGVEEQRGSWWPQNGEGIHTLAGEGEREVGRPSVREAGLFRGRKTTQPGETAMESEEEGCGPPCRHGNPETEAGAGGPSATGGPWGASRSSRRASLAPTPLAKPSPPRRHWHEPSPEMSSRAEGGEQQEAKGWTWDGVQINLHT